MMRVQKVLFRTSIATGKREKDLAILNGMVSFFGFFFSHEYIRSRIPVSPRISLQRNDSKIIHLQTPSTVCTTSVSIMLHLEIDGMTTTTVIWNWCMVVVEWCCFAIDHILTEWGVYNFLLSNQTNNKKKKNDDDDDDENDSSDDDFNDNDYIGTTSGRSRSRTDPNHFHNHRRDDDDDDKEEDVENRNPKSQRLEILTKRLQYYTMTMDYDDNDQYDFRSNVDIDSTFSTIKNVAVVDDDGGSTTMIDLWEVRELALSPGGLLNDTYRQALWPYLVGLVGHPQQQQQQKKLRRRRRRQQTLHRSSNATTTAAINTTTAVDSTASTNTTTNQNTSLKQVSDQSVLPIFTEEEEEEGTTTTDKSDSGSGNKETSTTRLIDNILEMPFDETTGNGGGGGGNGASQETMYGEQQIQRHIDGCIDLIRRDAGRSVVFRYTVVVEEEQQIQQQDDVIGGGDAVSVSRTITSILSAAPGYATQRLACVLEHVIRDGKRRHQKFSRVASRK